MSMLAGKERRRLSCLSEDTERMRPVLPRTLLPMVCAASLQDKIELTLAAKENRFDVVLIDTAGRMQDNEPLMRALAKVREKMQKLQNMHSLQQLVTVNNPDKIIFVGEALVGNEAVDQLTKFDRALKDFSASGIGGAARKRGIDGIILTKFDTIVRLFAGHRGAVLI